MNYQYTQPVPMRHQNWGPAGSVGPVSGVGGTSGALQQATAQPAPMPTPYPPQNNAPTAPQTSAMPGNTGIVPPNLQRPPTAQGQMLQQQQMMRQPMPQMGALQNWFSQQIPMWRQAAMQRPMQMPQNGQPMQYPTQMPQNGQPMNNFQQGMQMFNSYLPFGGLNMYSSWRR